MPHAPCDYDGPYELNEPNELNELNEPNELYELPAPGARRFALGRLTYSAGHWNPRQVSLASS